MKRNLFVMLAGLLVATAPAHAESCGGITARLTAKSRAADAALVKRQAGQPVAPDGIVRVINDGRWRLVWATPADAETGVYFFRRTAKGSWRYIDVWGGVIPPGEEPGARSWARRLAGGGPAARTISCFIAAVQSQ